MLPDLRQMRYVVAVAREGSFSRAALQLHVAQQALSQQVRTLETALGIELFERTNRGVRVTPAGEVFVQEARRTLNAADRVARRSQAAARGEVGTLRIAYTLATVYQTLPALVDALAAGQPELNVRPREVFGVDLERELREERADVALAPRTSVGPGLEQHEVRREAFALAVADDHALAAGGPVDLAAAGGETLELWPREMAPGYYEAVLAAFRRVGAEPALDEQAAGSSVWGKIARGDGVGVVVASLSQQLPRGIALVELESPAPTLTIDLVWLREHENAAVERLVAVAERVATERGWTRGG